MDTINKKTSNTYLNDRLESVEGLNALIQKPQKQLPGSRLAMLT